MVASWVYWLIIPLSLSPFLYIAYQALYKRYIQPAKYYKLVILDQTEEYTFYKKKNHALVIQDKKGFILFNNGKSGELYCVSTEDEALPSKRDDFGTVTFYYWRNNTNPIRFNDTDERINVTVDAKRKPIKGRIPATEITGLNVPIEGKLKEQIQTDNDANILYKVYHTNMLNSALMAEEKKSGVNTTFVIIAIGVIIAIVVFKDQIIKALGI